MNSRDIVNNHQGNRLLHIDMTRGLLLVLMSVDHARSFFNRSHPTEIWKMGFPEYDGDLFLFFIRQITHLCAPGFFLLMGTSMVLYSSRFEKLPIKY